MHIKETKIENIEREVLLSWMETAFFWASLFEVFCRAANAGAETAQKWTECRNKCAKNAKMCFIKTSFEKETTDMIGQKRIEIAEKKHRLTVFVGYLVRHPDISSCVQCCFGVTPFEPQKVQFEPKNHPFFEKENHLNHPPPGLWVQNVIFQGVKSKEIEIIHLGFDDCESINLNDWLKRTTSCLRCSFLADKIMLSRKQQTGRWLVNDLVKS